MTEKKIIIMCGIVSNLPQHHWKRRSKTLEIIKNHLSTENHEIPTEPEHLIDRA